MSQSIISHAGSNPDPSKVRASVALIGDAWRQHAEALADWAMARCVVRKDVYGAYRHNGGTYTAHEPLSRDLLIRHFRGETTIGAHSTSPDGRCTSVAFDIDAHTEADDPEANWRCALAVVGVFAGFGLKALVFDSNGKGGYHVRPFFKKPVYSAVARWLCDQVDAALKAAGFPIPESFPKQGELTIDCPFGNWIRLPGKHHKRDHWTRIYDPELGRWLEGEDAALRLIKIAGDDAGPLLKAYATRPEAAEADPAKERSRKERPKDGARDVELARDALGFIPNDGAGVEYDPWIGIGMALSGLGSDGRNLFHEWSSRSSKYDRETTDKKFESFSPDGGITLGSLFHRATESGWKRPQITNGKPAGGYTYKGNGATTAEDPLKWVEDGDVATLADVRRELGETRYLWDKWLPFGALSAVVAKGGLGKTRFVLDLALRLWLGEMFPDGSPNPLPAGTKTLWLCYDRHWWGLMDTAKAFGLPEEAILLPTRKGKPLWLPDFDDPGTMTLLERLIRKHHPGFVSIDTTTYATSFNTTKTHETKLAFDPIMGVMAEAKTACLALTHTNREGTLLNRRLEERARVVIKLSQPDEDHPAHIKVAVDKSDDRKPAPIGLTFTDGRNQYDDTPPEAPQPGKPGRKGTKTVGMAEWLWNYLQPGPIPVVDVIKAARDQELLASPTAQNPDPSISTLIDAKKRIPRLYPGYVVEGFTQITSKGKELKHWQLVEAQPF